MWALAAEQTNLRKDLFFATKYSSRDTSAQAEGELKASLQRMRTNYLDLQQAWNVNDANFSMAQLKEWKAAGTVRQIGITSSSDAAYDALAQVLERERPEFFQIELALLGDRDAEKVLLPAAQDAGFGAVLTNLPLWPQPRCSRGSRASRCPISPRKSTAPASRSFSSNTFSAIRQITAVIPGTDLPQYMLDNLNAGRGRMPDAAMRRRIETWFERNV